MCKLFKIEVFLPEWRILRQYFITKRGTFSKSVGLKWVKKPQRALYGSVSQKSHHSFCFRSWQSETEQKRRTSASTWRLSSQHPGSLVLFLGLPAASLIVDHSEQNPQVQKRDDEEPHQNCDKETPFNTRTRSVLRNQQLLSPPPSRILDRLIIYCNYLVCLQLSRLWCKSALQRKRKSVNDRLIIPESVRCFINQVWDFHLMKLGAELNPSYVFMSRNGGSVAHCCVGQKCRTRRCERNLIFHIFIEMKIWTDNHSHKKPSIGGRLEEG